MFRIRMLTLVIAATLAPLPFVATSVQAAQSAPKAATAKQKAEWEQTTQDVWEKLLAKANATQPKKPKNWDKVKLLIVDGIPRPGKAPMQFNAVATCLDDGTPVVYITRDYIEAYRGNEEALAYVLGHELGHHFLNHIYFEGVYKTQTKADIDQRRKESDADMFGAKLLLQCDYSLKGAIKANFEAMQRLKLNESSAKASWSDHPGEADRMARMAKLVSENEETLWRCMSAFDNGVYFLTIEDYTAAEACFLRVTQEFPNSHEAWANLGMAILMKYIDKMNAEELRRLDIGQFVSGIRFRSAKLTTRGLGIKEWLPAEAALLKAYKLNPKSTTILVALGLAYLTCPERTDKRMAQADDFFARAYDLANSPESDLEPEALAALLINRGVVRLAKGDTDDGQGLIEKAGKVDGLKGDDAVEVQNAVMFNRGMAQRAGGKNKMAIATFKKYLVSVPSNNPWWAVAYKAYFDMQMAEGSEPQSEVELAPKTNPVRRTMAVKLANGKVVHVGESVKDVRDKLGKPDVEGDDSATNLSTLSYTSLGVVFITDSEEVVGLTLTGENAPVILVKEKGPNGKVLGEVRIGMTKDEVRATSGVTDWISRKFTHLGRDYPYSPSLGVALIFGKGDKANVVVSILLGSIQTRGEEVVPR